MTLLRSFASTIWNEWTAVPLIEKMAAYMIAMAASNLSQPELGVGHVLVDVWGMPRPLYTVLLMSMIAGGIFMLVMKDRLDVTYKVILVTPLIVQMFLVIVVTVFATEVAFVAAVVYVALADILLSELGKPKTYDGSG